VTELPVQRFLLEAIAVLDRLGIPYAIMGGFAVRTWGVPRPTYDADLAVAVTEDRVAALLDALEAGDFNVPDEHRKGFFDRLAGTLKFKITRFEGHTVWQVDFFLVRGAFLESAIARRKRTRLSGQEVWVLAPEDLILLKLLAYRRKDQLDVEEILKVAKDVDVAYLRQWADFLGVTSRLEEFLRERPA